VTSAATRAIPGSPHTLDCRNGFPKSGARHGPWTRAIIAGGARTAAPGHVIDLAEELS